MLGHASAAMTLDVYSDPFDSDIDSASHFSTSKRRLLLEEVASVAAATNSQFLSTGRHVDLRSLVVSVQLPNFDWYGPLNCIKTGVSNEPSRPDWPPYSRSSDELMNFPEDGLVARADPRKERLDLVKKLDAKPAETPKIISKDVETQNEVVDRSEAICGER